MIIYPAIDMKGGMAVRLRQGIADDMTTYEEPAALARRWRDAGAQWLHLVDLDGAFFGESVNSPCVIDILAEVGIPIQLGGGIRSLQSIEHWLRLGVKRVVLGTIAAENPQVMRVAADAFGDCVAVGMDTRDGVVMTRGWVQSSGLDSHIFAQMAKDAGIKTLIHTDILKDGMMSGPSVSTTAEIIEKTGLDVIGSGGVSSLEDVRQLKDAGCAGVILGKSLLSGAFTIAQAKEVCEDG